MLWMFELDRGTFDPFTRLSGPCCIEWSPDGSKVLIQSNHHGGPWTFFVQSADGVGELQPLDLGDHDVHSGGVWFPDGNTIMFGASPADLYTVTTDGGDPEPFIVSDFIEGEPAVSPDGNWVAYASNDQGPDQIYVMPYPASGRRVLASTEGGVEPMWSRDGSELFYRNGDAMMSVSFDPEADPPLGTPEQLFRLTAAFGAYTVPNYDVTHDGRFVMLLAADDAEPSRLVMVVNWFDEVRRLAPGGR